MEPTSGWFESQGLKLHYADWGNPDAPPLILLHGVQDHCRSWDRIAERLSGDWHVIAPDLRGHGDSQWIADGIYSIDGYIFDLAELIETLGLAPVSMIAHSLGGRIALRYAGIMPDAITRLVAIEGLGPPPSQLADEAAVPADLRMRKWIADYRSLATREPRRYATVNEAAARMQEQNPKFDADLVRHLAVTGTRHNGDGTYSWKFDNRVRLSAPLEMTIADREAIWMSIACPLLLVHGTDSFLPDPRHEHRDRQFRDARIALIEGAGHWSHHDRTDALLELATGFLAGGRDNARAAD